MAQVTVDTVLYLQDFGLERLDEDRAIVGFVQKAEARLVRWLDFRQGYALVSHGSGDDESGTFYIYDRDRSSFYPLAPDRAAVRRFSRRGIRISHESL